MMYERPPTTPSQNPPRNTTFPFQNNILMFQQHQDIDYAAGGKLRRLSAEEAWETIEDCAQYDRKCSNPTSAISNVTIANPNAQIVRDDMVRVQVPRCMAWLDYDEHVDSLSTMDNEVGVTSPESTIQTLPSFEEYTPPVTYPKKVEKTLGTPIEVEPLNKKKLEEVGSNCNHNTPLSSREISSFDGPEPQPLLNSPSLDVSLGDVIGLEPPIKSHSPNSSRMKVVDYLTTQTPPSPHVTNSHPKGVYSYYNPGINDPKRHYGFKPGLIGKSVSLGVDILNWEMFEDDWGLESKEVSPLREELNLFDRPNEVERGRILKAHLLAYRVGLSYLDRSTSSVGRKSNAIFALPGDGSTSSIGHKSNVIFALPGHESTSSVDCSGLGSPSNRFFFVGSTIQGPGRRRTTPGESSGPARPNYASTTRFRAYPSTINFSTYGSFSSRWCMLAIFHDMIEESVEVFMDNFSVFGSSFDHCLNNLDKMLQRCKDAHLVLNWEKCHFMVKEGIVLGHKVSE
ncbi:hypothetical protein Tco_0871274 [Tanacetum coccineum]